MPCRMKGAAMQCCMCVVGVFMFLGGIIMTATGITLILNYGLLDIELLPPDLDNEEGKRTVGIILTTCGLLAVLVSVIVSMLYLCNKPKPSVKPDDMSRIPSSARNNTPDRPDYQRRNDRSNDRYDRRSLSSISGKVGNGHSTTGASKNPPTADKDIYSAEVKHRTPRSRAHRGKKHQARHKHRLDQIKEDAISRKNVDGVIEEDEFTETQRSGSFSSEMTLEDRQRIPKIVHEHVDDRDIERPPSADSASTSQTSDISGYRFSGEADKSRRELQFLPDYYQKQLETNSKDSASLDHYDETSLTESRNFDQCSLTSDNLRKFSQENDSPNPLPDYHSKTNHSAGGMTSYNGGAELDSPEVPSADDSVVSYKASHHTERHGEQTTGRISPQIGEPEQYTNVEAVGHSRTSLKSS